MEIPRSRRPIQKIRPPSRILIFFLFVKFNKFTFIRPFQNNLRNILIFWFKFKINSSLVDELSKRQQNLHGLNR